MCASVCRSASAMPARCLIFSSAALSTLFVYLCLPLPLGGAAGGVEFGLAVTSCAMVRLSSSSVPSPRRAPLVVSAADSGAGRPSPPSLAADPPARGLDKVDCDIVNPSGEATKRGTHAPSGVGFNASFRVDFGR